MSLKCKLAWLLLVVLLSVSVGMAQQDASQNSPAPANGAPPAATTQQPAQPQGDSQNSQTPATGTQPAATTQQPSQPPAAQQPPATQPADTQPQDQTPPATGSSSSQPSVRKGSRDDVDAIGNRGMGNRSFGNWYSLETEIRIGRQYSQMVEQSARLVTDPVIVEYINRIGQNLVRNSDAKVPFTIKVIDSDEVNAFALPGGFFYVNTGLILAADEEAELAGVMAHEIAHVCARHAMRQMTRMNLANLASIPLIFVGGGLGYGLYEAASIGLPLTFMKFSRNFEAEADFLGVQYMYKAGYDPQAFVQFFEKLQAQEKKKPGTIFKAFATHPQTPDRIEASQNEIAKILPARDAYIVNTSEFEDIKARLAALQNRHKPQDDTKGRPSLRRAGTSDTGNQQQTGDDRPTLKRRDE